MTKTVTINHSTDRKSDGTAGYLRKIRNYPMLDVETEYACAEAWQKTRDGRALQQLINSHLKLVAKMAIRYKGYGLPISDLISEGTVGLMQAVDKFDISKGNRFSTYATFWIKAALNEYVLKTWSMVKLGTTSEQKKLFFQLRRLKRDLREVDDNKIPDDYRKQIAEKMNISVKKVKEMDNRLIGNDYSLNTPYSKESESGEWQDFLPDDRDSQEDKYIAGDHLNKRSQLLSYALECLNPRELNIFKLRNLSESPPTLAVMAEEYGISRERVRQIESKAFEKVKNIVTLRAKEHRIS